MKSDFDHSALKKAEATYKAVEMCDFVASYIESIDAPADVTLENVNFKMGEIKVEASFKEADSLKSLIILFNPLEVVTAKVGEVDSVMPKKLAEALCLSFVDHERVYVNNEGNVELFSKLSRNETSYILKVNLKYIMTIS